MVFHFSHLTFAGFESRLEQTEIAFEALLGIEQHPLFCCLCFLPNIQIWQKGIAKCVTDFQS